MTRALPIWNQTIGNKESNQRVEPTALRRRLTRNIMHKMRFKDICKQIESAYRDSGNALGFRFLYCPKERLKKHNGILVLGLNPGGEKISKDFEVPNGLAYAVEAWGNGKYAR